MKTRLLLRAAGPEGRNPNRDFLQFIFLGFDEYEKPPKQQKEKDYGTSDQQPQRIDLRTKLAAQAEERESHHDEQPENKAQGNICENCAEKSQNQSASENHPAAAGVFID